MDIKTINYPGVFQKSVVPDTLDLAERAYYAVNGLLGMMDVDNNYEPYHCVNLNVHPAYMNHMTGGCCTPKVMEALLMTRIMSGRANDLDMDTGLLN